MKLVAGGLDGGFETAVFDSDQDVQLAIVNQTFASHSL